MEDFFKIISNYGFPIAVASYLLFRQEKKMDGNEASNLKIAQQQSKINQKLVNIEKEQMNQKEEIKQVKEKVEKIDDKLNEK